MTVVDQPRRRRYDVVIVGGGVAGLTTALQLEDAGADVLLIESGAETHDTVLQRYSSLRAEGDLPASYFPMHAQRQFGGTSNVWSGFCTVLEARSFLLGGWPIDYAELFEFYPDAAEILDLPEASWKHPVQPICESGNVVYKPYFRSPPTHFYEKYFSRFAEHPRIDVLLEHTVTRFERGKAGVGAAVYVPSATLDERSVRADQFVLAAGGLGNPRVLLRSEIGGTATTGAYLMEHPHVSNAGFLELDAACIDPVIEGLDAELYHAIAISDAACVARGIPSFSAQFHPKPGEANLLGARRAIVRSSVYVRAEMLPEPANRFSLLDVETRFGRTGHVRFRFPDRDTIREGWNVLGEIVLREGLGRLSTLNEAFQMSGGGHYLGTTRMGASPSDSVVDRDARVHGVANLYVAGSSVFPFGAAANPTFTLTALAARLGRHLKGVG